MNTTVSLPPDLRRWAGRHLPGLDGAAVTDASWPRGDSRIWRITAPSATAFVKMYPTPAAFSREQRGCEHAARVLAEGEAPRVIAADETLLAVILTGLPGQVVRGLHLETAEEERVHEMAGRLLRRWHDGPTALTGRDRTAVMDAVTAQAREAAACLDQVGGLLSPAERDLVRTVATSLPGLARDLPLVFRHGDY
ncbi:phosphotransferase [Streptomyces sp. NPDC088789]|uniref:phosphotransferase n=1 Tax=Streptomyces sp. NPDC088789 TaxID=3365899 RepID=UPI0037FE9B42